MRVQLQINSAKPRKLFLRDGYVYQIGRTEAADVVVAEDGHMSGLHFSLELRSGACLLRDLRSANGTKVNGEPTTEKRLKDGDTIVAGKTSFVIQIEGATAGPNLTETRMTIVEPVSQPAKPQAAPTRPARSAPTERLPASVSAPVTRPARAVFPDYDRGWQDPDSAVRRQAMLAAIWTRQNWVMDRLRAIARVASAENPNGLWLLGVLGEPGDLPEIMSIARDRNLGPERFRVLGAYGHPETVGYLLGALRDADPAIASAAGAAFLKITGFNMSSSRAKLPAAEGTDDFEREFVDEVEVVDPELAADRWEKESSRFGQAARWCRGHNVSDGAGSVLSELDRASRAEAILRDHFREIAPGDPRDLVKFVRPHRV